MMEPIKLKKTFQTWLTQGSPEAVDRYQRARRTVALKQKRRCGMSLRRPQRRTFGWPQTSSGKPSDGLGMGSRVLGLHPIQDGD